MEKICQILIAKYTLLALIKIKQKVTELFSINFLCLPALPLKVCLL